MSMPPFLHSTLLCTPMALVCTEYCLLIATTLLLHHSPYLGSVAIVGPCLLILLTLSFIVHTGIGTENQELCMGGSHV